MNLELLKIAITALKSNRLRTALTMLGVILGTGIVVVILSVGAGLESLILQQISSIQPESLYIEIKVPSEGSRAAQDQNTAQSIATGVKITTLTLDDVADIKEHYNIEYGSGMLIHQAKLVYGSESKISTIFAVQEDYQLIEDLGMQEGRFFKEEEGRSLSQVVVLGSGVKEELFGRQEAVGKRLKIEQNQYEVIGVAEEVGSQFFLDLDETIYIPTETVQKKLMGIDYVQAISLEMIDPNFIGPTIRDIENTLRRNHQIKDPSKDDFVVRTMDEAMDIVGTISLGVSALLLAIAAISLVVGGVGIMNIMYVSVSERTKEIGLRKALGAKPRIIKRQFIFEAILITVLGGAAGAAGGLALSWLTSFVAQSLNFNWPFIFEAPSLALALGLSISVGFIFGYGPAKKAAELDPIVALRRS